MIPTAKITHEKTSDIERFFVTAFWSGVDRERGYGISCGKKKHLAERLKASVDAGVVFSNPTIETDVNGATYVSASCNVSGRRLNADLCRLGF